MLQRKKFYVSILTVLVLVFISFQTVFASSGTTLKTGMNGKSVLQLQKDLKALGFFKVTPTGYFGDATKAAVVKFQKKYGLTADGIAGTRTLAKANNLVGRKVTTSRGDGASPTIVDYARRFLGVDYVWGGIIPIRL